MKNISKCSVVLLIEFVVLLFIVSARIGQETVPVTYSEDGTPMSETQVTVTDPYVEPVEEDPLDAENLNLPDVTITDWNFKIVNNYRVLAENDTPEVEEFRDGQYINVKIAEAAETFLQAAEAEGYTVCVRNAYRPYSTQAYLFFGRASQIAYDGTVSYEDAEMMARKIIAYPGTSEHQTALCMDVMDSAETTMDSETAADIPVLIWMTEHCTEYGFILRYPENKKNVTGWYEPWHFRYVGVEAAEFMKEYDLCLEEFVELYY